MTRHISRLRLTAFRNYASAALDLDARHVVLTGPNGAGKTNLLEAISVLSPGRGLRGASFETLQAHGSDSGWAVAATVETDNGPADIGTGAAPEGGRRVRINGANARSIEAMSDYLRVLWLTPAMDGLYMGPAGERRRFLDRLVTTLIPTHSAAVGDFDKAMRQRNRLLEAEGDPRWLAAIEAQMAELGAAIHINRSDSLYHLQELIAESLDDGSFPAAQLSLTPLLEDAAEPQSSAELEALLMQRWHAQRGLDRAAGRTTSGPHRVDLEVVYAQKGVRAGLGSTGEQKALLIGQAAHRHHALPAARRDRRPSRCRPAAGAVRGAGRAGNPVFPHRHGPHAVRGAGRAGPDHHRARRAADARGMTGCEKARPIPGKSPAKAHFTWGCPPVSAKRNHLRND
jgi:DNA replication and repair protein RecF